jgi:predicted ATPase
LRRLAVFAGDFTAEAASLVAPDSEIGASAVIRSLANLVTKSLVALEIGGAIAYHRLHETTRAYALEKLAESGEFEQVARRHANYYRNLFDRAEMETDTLPAPQAQGCARIDREQKHCGASWSEGHESPIFARVLASAGSLLG